MCVPITEGREQQTQKDCVSRSMGSKQKQDAASQKNGWRTDNQHCHRPAAPLPACFFASPVLAIVWSRAANRASQPARPSALAASDEEFAPARLLAPQTEDTKAEVDDDTADDGHAGPLAKDAAHIHEQEQQGKATEGKADANADKHALVDLCVS